MACKDSTRKLKAITQHNAYIHTENKFRAIMMENVKAISNKHNKIKNNTSLDLTMNLAYVQGWSEIFFKSLQIYYYHLFSENQSHGLSKIK